MMKGTIQDTSRALIATDAVQSTSELVMPLALAKNWTD